MGKVGASISPATNSKELFDAVLAALEANTNTGGGGGATQPFPDIVVVGSGPSNYVIPVGFNAIVVANQGFEKFTVNGAPMIEASGREVDTTVSITGSGHINNNAIYTSKNPDPIRVSGVVELFGQGPGFQIGGQVFVGSTLIGTLPSHPTASGVAFPYDNLVLNFNESIRVSSVVTWFNPPSPLPTFNNTGFGLIDPIASTSMKLELPEGSIISGGRYVVGLYAI